MSFAIALAAVVVLYILNVLIRSGLFRTVVISPKRYGGGRVLLKTFTGPYKDVGRHFESVLKLIGDNLLVDTEIIGIYHDNPEAVSPEKCRSSVGCVVDSISDSDTRVAVEKKLSDEGYKMVTLPAQDAVWTEFPFTGIISVMLSIWKVYGAFKAFSKGSEDQYMAAHIEITRMGGVGMTEFYFPKGETCEELKSYLKDA